MPPSAPGLPRSAYGKLPISREYIRLACEGGAARRFRDLLDRSAAVFREGPKEGAAAHRLVFDQGPRHELVVASVWASADEGGRRPFPFAVYTALPPERRPTLDLGFWAALDGLAADQAEVYQEARDGGDATGFERRFGAAGRPVPDLLDGAEARRAATREATAVPLDAWARAALGATQEERSACLWRVEQLRRKAAGNWMSLADRCSGLRLPLSREWPLAVQADTWLDVLGSLALRGAPSSLILDALGPGTRASVTLLLREVTPPDLGVLEGRAIPDLIDLTEHRDPVDLDGFGIFSRGVDRTVDDPKSSLANLRHLFSPSIGLTSGSETP